MGRRKRIFYEPQIESVKKRFYAGLAEKQARHFLGQEYLELGIGSQSYMAEVFGCSRQTIKKGADEVGKSGFQADYTRQRMVGAGRKKRSGD